MNNKVLLTLIVYWMVATVLPAQDTNEFQRIARRIMDAYDIGDEVEHAPDSASLYGGAYLGAGSNGRAMPSAYITWLKDKTLLTSQLSVDISKQNSEKDVTTQFNNESDRHTNSDILTSYQKQDFSIRLDYAPTKRNIFTIGFLESLDHKKVEENTVKNGHGEDGTNIAAEYEEQRRTNHDLKLGGLLQYIYETPKAGRLTTRLNLKYNYKPTDIYSDTWGANTTTSMREQRQTLYNFDPYAMIRFQSKAWNGFKFTLEEKYTIEDMRIKDTETAFDFNTYSSLSSLSVNYSHSWIALNATLKYEHFVNDIDNHQTETDDRTYDDWMMAAKATMKINDKNKFVISADRNVQRPTYTQLYPFVHIGSSIGVMVVGNPALEPSKNMQLKASYTYSGKHWNHTHSLAYKRITDDITQISSFDELSQRSVKTWVNDSRYGYLRYAAEGEMMYGQFSMTMGLHAQYLDYEGEKVSSDHAWSYSFKLRPQLKLPGDWTLATVLLYTGRETHRYYYYKPNLYLSMRAVKQLGNWAIYAFVQDILQPNKKQVLTNNDQNTVTLTKPNTRCLIVGCSYTF